MIIRDTENDICCYSALTTNADHKNSLQVEIAMQLCLSDVES